MLPSRQTAKYIHFKAKQNVKASKYKTDRWGDGTDPGCINRLKIKTAGQVSRPYRQRCSPPNTQPEFKPWAPRAGRKDWLLQAALWPPRAHSGRCRYTRTHTTEVYKCRKKRRNERKPLFPAGHTAPEVCGSYKRQDLAYGSGFLGELCVA